MRILMVPIMAIIFIGWVFYITLIKKEFKKHKSEVFGGFCFIAVWLVLYVVLIHI